MFKFIIAFLVGFWFSPAITTANEPIKQEKYDTVIYHYKNPVYGQEELANWGEKGYNIKTAVVQKDGTIVVYLQKEKYE